MRQRSLVAAALGLGALLLAGCAGQPSTTGIPPALQEKGDAVAVCYDPDATTRAEVEKVARKACPKEDSEIRLWREDVVFNGCPLFKKTRATFLCVAPTR